MLYFYLAYFHFIATEQPGVAATAMWTGAAIGDSGIFTLALVTPRDGWYGIHLQFATLQHRLLVGSPTPTVAEQVRHNG